jgi:hypothetical protein
MWRGEFRLWAVFWAGGILGLPLVYVVIGWPLSYFGLPPKIASDAIGITVFLALYSVVVWRSAWNCSRAIWGYVARAFVVLHVALLIPLSVAIAWLAAPEIARMEKSLIPIATNYLNSSDEHAPRVLRTTIGTPISSGAIVFAEAVFYGDSFFRVVFPARGPGGERMIELILKKGDRDDWKLTNLNVDLQQQFSGTGYTFSLYRKST